MQGVRSRFSEVLITTAITACLFFAVWGAKIAVVNYAGSDLPSWDQWDAEGKTIFVPYSRGELKWTDFFKPHNEHRIACSRALAFGLFVLNGQWDTRLECVANAALHALLAVAVFLFARSAFGRGWSTIWFFAAAIFIGLPVSWHNTIGGVHSQQYFLLLFSVLGIAGMLTGTPNSPLWWAGVVFVMLSLFSMASGLLAPLSIGLAVLLTIRLRKDWCQHWPTLTICCVLVAGGLYLNVTASGHESLKAASVGDFFICFWRSLQWPVLGFVWYPLLAWLPWLLLGLRVVSKPGDSKARDRILFCVGIWVLLQFGATAYSRGAGGPWPANRYLDTVALGILLNLLCLFLFFQRTKIRSIAFGVTMIVASINLILLGMGLSTHLKQTITTTLPFLSEILPKREINTRNYLLTGDRSHLDGKDIPHVNADTLIDCLNYPELRSILPESVRPPLPLMGASDPSTAFSSPGTTPIATSAIHESTWDSYKTNSPKIAGTWISDTVPPATLPYWQFEFAGTPDDNDLSARIVDQSSNTSRDLIVPGELKPDQWIEVHIPAPPPSAASLQVTDSSEHGWVAFRGPVELGRFSYYAKLTARGGMEIASIFFGIGAIILCIEFVYIRREAGTTDSVKMAEHETS